MDADILLRGELQQHDKRLHSPPRYWLLQTLLKSNVLVQPALTTVIV